MGRWSERWVRNKGKKRRRRRRRRERQSAARLPQRQASMTLYLSSEKENEI